MLAAGLATPAAGAVPSPSSTAEGVLGVSGDRTITFVGVIRNRTDLAALGVGTAGSWFPQFGAGPEPVRGAATEDNARDELPHWVTPFNHTTGPADPGCTDPGALEGGCLPTYLFRTFSRDAAIGSYGGIDGWSALRLPSGECGASGAIVDPQTIEDGEGNTNNSVNRIQLREGTPASFYVSVLTDNTANDHDPALVAIRGNVGILDVPDGRSQVEPDVEPRLGPAAFNRVPDLYVFHVANFTSGDFLKLRLRGMTAPASFGGLLFDTDRPEPGNGESPRTPSTAPRRCR